MIEDPVALEVSSIDCYLFDGKYHRLYRRLISLLSAYESALAELWHFCQLALAERLISSIVNSCYAHGRLPAFQDDLRQAHSELR